MLAGLRLAQLLRARSTETALVTNSGHGGAADNADELELSDDRSAAAAVLRTPAAGRLDARDGPRGREAPATASSLGCKRVAAPACIAIRVGDLPLDAIRRDRCRDRQCPVTDVRQAGRWQSPDGDRAAQHGTSRADATFRPSALGGAGARITASASSTRAASPHRCRSSRCAQSPT